MKPFPSYRKFLALAGSTSVFLSCLPAFAADATWNVNAGGNWFATGNWLPTAAPGATSGSTNTDTATFGSAILQARLVTVDTNRNLTGITFSGNSFVYTLSSGNLLLTNGGLIQTSGNGAAHTDIISTVIAIQGDGGAATFTSGASINGSIMSLGAVTGVSTGANVTNLTLNGTNGTSSSASTITGIIGNGGGGGKLAVTKSGGGIWILSGVNTYSGGLTLTGGTLKFGNNSAIGAATGTFTVNGGTFDTATGSVTFGNNPQIWNGDFTFTGSNNLTFGSGVITLGTAAGTSRTVTVAGSSLVVGGAISNGTTANSLIKAGAGELSLSGAGTYTGGVTLNGGTLKLGSTTALGTSAGTLTINGGTLDSSVASLTNANNNPQTWNVDFTFGGTNTLNLGTGTVSLGTLAGTSRSVTVTANTLTVGGIISNGTTATSLIKAGAGTLVLSGANTFTGGVTLSAGTLKFGNTTALGTAAGTFTINGGAFDVTSGLVMGNYPQTWNSDFTFIGSGTLAFGTGAVSLGTAAGTSRSVTVSGNSLTIPGVISNGTTANSLIKLGNGGPLILSGVNAYTGGTTVTVGELQFTTAGSVPNTGNLLVNGGVLTIKNNNTSLSNNNTVTVQSGTLNISASSSNNQTLGGTGTVNTGPTITLGNAANLTDVTSTIAVTTSTVNLNNPINVVGKSSTTSVYNNVISIGANPSKQAGSITLAGNGTSYRTNLKLDIVLANNTGGFGAVSGTGNVLVSVSANPNTAPTVGVLNNLGTVTVSGGGVSGSLATLDLTGLGANVTGLTISATAPTLAHPITISGANSTFIGDTTLSAGAGFTQLANTNALQNSVINLVSGSFSFGSLTAASLGGLTGAQGVNLNNATPAAVALTIGNSNSLNSAGSNTLFPSYSGILSNTIAGGSLVKVGSNSQIFTGASTYTGTTTISGGMLTLGTGGSLGNTAITVGSGATLSAVAGRFVGNTGTPAAGATLTLNSGSTLSLADNTVGNFTINRGSSATGNVLTLAGGTLQFDIGSSTSAVLSTSDTLLVNVGPGAVAATGNNIISVNTGTATSLFVGATYNIITANSGLGTANYVINNPNASFGGSFFHFTVGGTATQEVLTVAPGLVSTLLSAFWTGSENGSWASQNGTTFKTNFSGVATTPSPNAYALPDLNANVIMVANSAINLSTTLDANFTINSLAFSGTGTNNTAGSTIASGTGTQTLTINAAALNGNTAGNGISVFAGSGLDTISANVALAISQTWTNNSSNALVVSGVVSEASAGLVLTKAGAGPLSLAGNNTYTGGTFLTAGTLNINAQGTGAGNSALGTGRLTLSNSTLDNTSAGTVDLSGTTNNVQTWNNALSLVFTGTRALNLGTGAVTWGTSAATDAMTLTNNSALAGTSFTIGGAITPGTGGTAGVKTLNIAGIGSTALTGNITYGSATAIDLNDTSPGTLTISGTSNLRTLTLSGVGSSTVNLGTGNLTLANGGAATLVATTNSTINSTGAGTLTLGANSDDIGAAAGVTLTINAKITGVIGNTFEIFHAGGGTVVLTNTNAIAGPVRVSGGTLSVSSIANNLGTGTDNILLGNLAVSTVLLYNASGTGEITNRIININGSATATAIDQSGTGLLKFTGAVNSGIVNSGDKILTLKGSSAGTGELAGIISNGSGGTQAIVKTGTGTWTLSGANSYTGSTTVSGGVLAIGTAGTINTTSGVAIGSTGDFRYNNSTTALSLLVSFSSTGGTLSGTGAIAPATTIPAGNSVAPGSGGTGILSFNTGLTITGTYVCDVSGVNSDKLAVTGNLDISAATLAVSGIPTAPSYTIASYTGTLTGTTFGTISPAIPAGYFVVVDSINKLILLQEGTYSTWAVVKGLTGANNGTLDDADNDSIFNLLEYVLNGNPLSTSLSILPTVTLTPTNYIFSFNRRYESKDDTTQVFQYGSTLTNWIDITIPATSSGSVTVTANTPSAGIDLVQITILRAGNPIILGRLKVSK